MRYVAAVAVAVCLASASGCRNQDGEVRPAAYPQRAYATETVAVTIGTNYPNIWEPVKAFDASVENVAIELEEVTTGLTVAAPVRSVISSQADPSTPWAEQFGSTEIQIVVFDVPTPLPFSSYPTDVYVRVLRAGTGGAPFYGNGDNALFAKLEILGDPGNDPTDDIEPTAYWPPAILDQLAPLPGLRLRADPSGFDPTWTIGSVQFDITYPAADLSNPRAYAKGEATGGLAYAAERNPGAARVLLVHPSGFSLEDATGEGVRGGGPFLDLAFDKIRGFGAQSFMITDLIVTDPDGVPLIDHPGDSLSYFQLIPRRNL